MPIEITKPTATVESDTQVDVAALLTKDGQPTLEGKVIAAFLETVDFTDILDDEDGKEFVEGAEAIAKVSDDAADIEIVEGATTLAEGQEFVIVETMSGEDAAELVDEDDLFGMFEHYVRHLPEATTQEKVEKAAAINLLGEEFVETLEEASVFKKGEFRKLHKGTAKTPGGKTGPELVKRMLVAMMKKEAINRAKKPGAGYKGGDYVKNPSGYGGGTPKGKKAVALFKGKNAGKVKQAAKKVKGAAGADAKLKAKAKGEAAKKKAKAAMLAKKKPSGKGDKKSLVASDHTTPAANLSESALAMTRKLVGGQPKPAPLNEAKK